MAPDRPDRLNPGVNEEGGNNNTSTAPIFVSFLSGAWFFFLFSNPTPIPLQALGQCAVLHQARLNIVTKGQYTHLEKKNRYEVGVTHVTPSILTQDLNGLSDGNRPRG
jgi:hypothetical protein